MKNSLKLILGITMCLTIACANGNKTVVETDSPEAQVMLDKLKAIAQQRQFMFGHHDDPVYGIGWDGDSARSDVKSVCGDYPAMMSFDLGSMGIRIWIMYRWLVFVRRLSHSMNAEGCRLSVGMWIIR